MLQVLNSVSCFIIKGKYSRFITSDHDYLFIKLQYLIIKDASVQ